MKWGLLLVLLFLLQSASAATIQGTVYDLSLFKLRNVAVTIDSSPAQRYVAQEGRYSFEVPNGYYTLKVTNLKGNETFAFETIKVEADGNYTLDIIIFPDEELDDIDLEDIDVPEADSDLGNGEQFPSPVKKIIIVLVLIAAFFIAKMLTKKYRHKPVETKEIEKDDLNKVLAIIKQEGGRINQKDLRKHFSLSEAKMSLLISELEAKGSIQKIKKGRGNILVLK